jgi:Multicopper oxidase/Copper resistance protein B precursor (CopB)
VRLRFINGSSMSIFDVPIVGLPMTVVQADGNDVAPVTVDEFRISVAETYDVIVWPTADRAYTIFAQAEDRSGFARGTLATRPGMAAPIPPMDSRPMRTMADMGMGSMEQGSMSGMKMDQGPMPGMDHAAMPGMNHGSMQSMPMDQGSMAGMSATESSPEAKKLQGRVEVDNVALTAALAAFASTAAAQTPVTNGEPVPVPGTKTASAVQPVMDQAIFAHLLFNQLEGRWNGSNTEFRWDGQGWVGSDYDKLWIKSEGTLQSNGTLEDGLSISRSPVLSAARAILLPSWRPPTTSS